MQRIVLAFFLMCGDRKKMSLLIVHTFFISTSQSSFLNLKYSLYLFFISLTRFSSFFSPFFVLYFITLFHTLSFLFFYFSFYYFFTIFFKIFFFPFPFYLSAILILKDTILTECLINSYRKFY